MEKKLEEYRARKLKEKSIMNAKSKIREFFTFNRNNQQVRNQFKRNCPQIIVDYFLLQITGKEISDYEKADNEETVDLLSNDCELDRDTSDSYLIDDEDENLNCCTYIDIIRFILYFTLWASLYGIFIKLEFGIVYLIISSIVIMYLNTRTKPKRKGEVSAYSVFNRNCKSIDGTLKAEQLEKQLLFR